MDVGFIRGFPISLQLLPITVDEYFVKSVEFALWLKEERGTFFSSLTSEQSHELFTEFVEVWNAGRLSEKYYAGMEKAPRTSHNWGLALPPDAAGEFPFSIPHPAA